MENIKEILLLIDLDVFTEERVSNLLYQYRTKKGIKVGEIKDFIMTKELLRKLYSDKVEKDFFPEIEKLFFGKHFFAVSLYVSGKNIINQVMSIGDEKGQFRGISFFNSSCFLEKLFSECTLKKMPFHCFS